MKIQNKRSKVLDGLTAKEPTAGQTDYGEICVNFNALDPSLFLSKIVTIILFVSAGVGNIADDGTVNVPSTPNPPPTPEEGNLWFNPVKMVGFISIT